MSFTKEQVKKNAKLVRIGMTDEMLGEMVGKLDGMLDWITSLDEVDTEGKEPLISVCEHSLPRRPDTIKMENNREDIMKNSPAPDEEGEFFTVPKILE